MSTASVVYGHLGAISGTNVVTGAEAVIPTGSNNIVIGNGAGANIGAGAYNVVIGTNADASGVSYATAVGQGAIAKANYAVAIGQGVVNTIANSCIIGNSANPMYAEHFGRGLVRYTRNGELNAGGGSNAMTVTGAQVCDGFIMIQTNLTGTVYWPTAADIVSAFVDPQVGCVSLGYFGTYYTGSSGYYIYIETNDGITYQGPADLTDGESGLFVLLLTNVTAGTEAVDITWYYT